MSIRVESEPPDPWQSPGVQTVATAPPADIATALLECMLNSRGAQQESARADAEHARALLERAREEIRRAMERAEEAEEKGGIWGDVGCVLGSDVASIAGVVGAVALAVATGGAGAPAVLAMIAAGLTVGAKAGQELGLDPRVTLALGATGGVLGFLAGNMASTGNGWATLAQIAGAVQGGATGGGGGAYVVEGQYRSEAADHRAEATEARGRQQDAWLRLELAIDMLDRASREVSRATERTSDIVNNDNDGRAAVISRIGAA